MELEEWGFFALLVLVALGVITAMTVPTTNFLVASTTPPSNASSPPPPNITQDPHPPPHNTPTPRRTSTPWATPRPQPTATPTPWLRWCNESGCFNGTIPTPTPTPTPITTPTPEWMVQGFKCEVPDDLLDEPWVVAYKYECACMVRGRFDLGDRFSVFDGCFSATSTGWRRESCDCVEVICRENPRLC